MSRKRPRLRCVNTAEHYSLPVSYEVFAEGWLQGNSALGRPVDIEFMPDGSLIGDIQAALLGGSTHSGDGTRDAFQKREPLLSLRHCLITAVWLPSQNYSAHWRLFEGPHHIPLFHDAPPGIADRYRTTIPVQHHLAK